MYPVARCAVPTRLGPHVWNPLAAVQVTFLEGCRTKCVYRDKCVGVHRSYVKHAGAPDIVPISAERPVELSDNRYHPFLSAKDATPTRA
jgi:hypothetical protein